VSAQASCEHHEKFVIVIALGGTLSKWPWVWALVSPLGEEHRGSWAPSLESFLNEDVAPMGVNFKKQITVLSCLLYLHFSLVTLCHLFTRVWDRSTHIHISSLIQLVKYTLEHTQVPANLFDLLSLFRHLVFLSLPSYPDILDNISGDSGHKVRSIVPPMIPTMVTMRTAAVTRMTMKMVTSPLWGGSSPRSN
jgi:hypothetical protein